MGKISCDIIRDLLPVYGEGEASCDTVKLVEEHLRGCEECQKVFNQLQSLLVVPVETESRIMEKMKKRHKRKRFREVLCIMIFLMLSFGFVYSIYKDSTMELDASDLRVEVDSDGQVLLLPSERAKNCVIHRIYSQDEDGNASVYLSLEKDMDVILFLDGPLEWIAGYFKPQNVPLDVYKAYQNNEGNLYMDISTEPTAGSDDISLLYNDVIILGDSIEKVYYQPGIENETSSFRGYMDKLFEKAKNITDNCEKATKMIYSDYKVPESSGRTLIYQK